MSLRGRTPSANNPSPELLRELRRTKTCRGYAGGSLIWEERIYDPPPVWLHLVRHEPRVSLTDEWDAPTMQIPHTEVTFYWQGVEVDNRGTWVRYGLAPLQAFL